MTRLKKSLPVILIATSLMLLVVFQIFWLTSVYHEAENRFKREAYSLFRTTVFSMYDSLMQRKIEPVKLDTTIQVNYPPQLTFKEIRPLIRSLDTANRKFQFSQQRVEVIMSTTDSSGKTKLTRRTQGEAGTSFILKLDADSLKIDSIKRNFENVLSQAELPIDFKVSSIAFNPRNIQGPIPGLHDNRADIVFVNPHNRYAVSFKQVNSFILKTITPQIIFCIVLTLIVATAFYVMYRNLRSQEKLMQLKNDFISNITHELKTPVATVSVALEALKNFNALNDQRRTTEYLDIAQSELNRLTLMTDKILKTSVFEERGVDINKEIVDMGVVAEQVLGSMKLIFEKRKIKAELLKAGIDFTCRASKPDMTNVLYNLVDNACKYSADGATIQVYVSEKEKELELKVVDTGIGIPEEYRDRVFEKFFRVPSGDVHNIKGYGLGLSYVASVVRAHDGKISVESAPGVGSTFTIILPKL